MDPIEQALATLKEISDDDLAKALSKLRPELKIGGEAGSGDESQVEAAKEEGRKELVAALAEKGITVALSEDGKGDEEPSVDISKHPDFVALGERVGKIEGDATRSAAEAMIDAAIEGGKVLPNQREAMLEVALSEGGIDRVKKLIPEKPIAALGKELGVELSEDTVGDLDDAAADEEVDRLVSAYVPGAGKEDK